MDIPASLAAQTAISRQNVALSVVKQSAETDQAFAKVIYDAARSAPAGGSRGTNVDILV